MEYFKTLCPSIYSTSHSRDAAKNYSSSSCRTYIQLVSWYTSMFLLLCFSAIGKHKCQELNLPGSPLGHCAFCFQYLFKISFSCGYYASWSLFSSSFWSPGWLITPKINGLWQTYEMRVCHKKFSIIWISLFYENLVCNCTQIIETHSLTFNCSCTHHCLFIKGK